MTTSTAPPAPPSFLRTRRGRLTLALLCAVAFMDLLDASIVNVALPQIQAHLHPSVQDLQWVAGAYLLTYGGFLLLGGRLADLLGRRRLLVAGTALFGVTSLVCGLAGTEAVLIGGRLLQGVSAALMTPAALSILTTSFHTREDRVRAIGAWGGMAGMAGASGAFFGGVLTSEVSWRWVFFVNLPIVLAVLVASFRLLDAERPPAPPLREFDTVGAGLITGGMLLLVYALVNASTVGWGSARTVGQLTGALGLVALFLWSEARHSHPLVPLSLFRVKGLWEADVTQVLSWAAFYTMFFIITLYLQDVLGYTAIRTGLGYLPLTAGIGLGALAATKGIPRLGTRPLIVTGALLGAAGVLLLARVPLHGGYAADVLPGMVVMGAGLGLVMVGTQNAANGGVPADEAGLAASLITASFQLGSALGLAVLVSIATSRTDALLAAHVPHAEAVRLGFQRGLVGAALALVVAAAVALRAPDVHATVVGVDEAEPIPVPV